MHRFYHADFAAIDLGQFSDYLLSKGWTLLEQIGKKATVWGSPDGSAEVWVPLRRDFRDFGRIVESSLLTLESVENRPSESILRDMTMRWADVSRFRVDTGNLGAGSISLPDGLRLLTAARETISAAARWLTERRAVYYTRPQEKISDFLRNLQMGQTEVGSFVITVISPLYETNADFSRQAMSQVFSAINATKELAETAIATTSLDVFSRALDRGVNANLCDALTTLGELSPDGSVDIRFTWAAHERLPQPTGNMVLISAPNLRIIDAASRHLRTLEPDEETTLSGLVRVTKERGGYGDERESELEIKARIDGRFHNVRLSVRGDYRHRAFDATERRLAIRVKGVLDRSRIPFVLYDVTALDVIEGGEFVSFLDELFTNEDK